MSLPGPGGALWAIGLLAWGASIAVVGEAVRGVAARWVRLWRSPELVERVLLDLYLGGAVLFLIAAWFVGAFTLPVLEGVSIGAAAFLAGRLARDRRRRESGGDPRGVGLVLGPWAALAAASALALFGIETAAALSAGSGNTYDASLLTTYAALLLQHGSIPLSFHPYGSSLILYPQGTTVWLGAAQATFGLPPARTSLLVTPLFLALPPLAGYSFGRRVFASDRAGAAVALTFAWLGPATRAWVGGSNDFVFAFPLVLLLAGHALRWDRDQGPGPWDALGFGLLLGYAAAINPVGAEWLVPTILLAAWFARPSFGGAWSRWFRRWGLAIAASLVALVPTLFVLFRGLGSPGFVFGAPETPGGIPIGITGAQFLGSIDPFLFRAGDVQLSPIPLVRAELAVLLVAGLAFLLVGREGSGGVVRLGLFRRWALAAGATIVGLLGLLVIAGATLNPVRNVAYLTNATELSAWLFTVYGLVAAVPLVLAFERLSVRSFLSGPVQGNGGPRPERSLSARSLRPSARNVLAPWVAVLVIVVPGVVLTPTQLSPVLGELYGDFGAVSPADFTLLEEAPGFLPPGSRVLVAPGSAAQFLPGYAHDVVLLFPMAPGWAWVNASYSRLVEELSQNATLDAAGHAAFAALEVQFVLVTGPNTILWPPFSPAPLLADPTNFTVVFHDGDAWAFAVT